MATPKSKSLKASNTTPTAKISETVSAKAAAEVKAAAPAVVAAPAAAAPAVVAAPAAPVVVAPVAVKPAAAVLVAPARDRSAVISLIAKLRDVDAEVARDAAQTLGGLPVDHEAVEALGNVVKNADGYFHSVVRAAAAHTLGKLGDRNAVEALIIATRDPMAEASQEAVIALGLLGDTRALPVLRDIVANAEGFYLEYVQKSAQEAVARINLHKKA